MNAASVVNTTKYTLNVAPREEVAPEINVAPTIKEEDLFDEENIFIADGTPCLRPGCLYKYNTPGANADECIFHASTPVFHEGSKVREDI